MLEHPFPPPQILGELGQDFDWGDANGFDAKGLAKLETVAKKWLNGSVTHCNILRGTATHGNIMIHASKNCRR